jgi:flagellar biosynthesis protein FlhF
MQLRTFLARDMKEALATVRTEMGDEAVIVGSQKTKDGGVLVRAAFDRPEETLAAAPEITPAETGGETVAPISFESEQRHALVRRLRGEPSAGAPAARGFNRAELLALLRNHRAPAALAHALAQSAEQSGLSDMALALASALDRRMKAAPAESASSAALLLVGPHGAGKTAVAAKLAAHARLSARPVALIATDRTGAGAVARLETFATHLDTRFEVIDQAEALAKAVAACAKQNETAIIDTAGFDPRNGKARAAFSALAQIETVEAVGVVSACGDAEEISELVAALSTLGARRLIVTCADLVRRLGSLLAAATGGLPLAHVTRSPYVAGGLETLTPLSLARALIATDGNADGGSTQ